MKTLLVILISALVIGCSYSTRVSVGEFGASHSASVHKGL